MTEIDTRNEIGDYWPPPAGYRKPTRQRSGPGRGRIKIHLEGWNTKIGPDRAVFSGSKKMSPHKDPIDVVRTRDKISVSSPSRPCVCTYFQTRPRQACATRLISYCKLFQIRPLVTTLAKRQRRVKGKRPVNSFDSGRQVVTAMARACACRRFGLSLLKRLFSPHHRGGGWPTW